MAEARTNHTYYALRVRSDAVAPEWWAAAHARGADAPQPVRALLTGRTRVELSPEEAIRAIQWVAQLTGWNDDGEHPRFITRHWTPAAADPWPPPDETARLASA